MPLVAKLVLVFIVVFIVKAVVLYLVWAWLVPDMFPGAVAQGLIVASLPWATVFKIAFITALFATLFKAKMHYRCKKFYDVHKK